MNLGQIRDKVKKMLGRDDHYEAPIDDFINFAADRIARAVRIPALETATTAAVQEGGYIVLPGGLMFLRYLYVGDHQLVPEIPDRFRRMQNSTADEPCMYLQVGQRAYLAPVPPTDSLVGVTYFRQDDTLVHDADTSVLSRSAPDALIYGALYECCILFNDERADRFDAQYNRRVDELAQQSSEFYQSLGPIYQRSYHEDF